MAAPRLIGLLCAIANMGWALWDKNIHAALGWLATIFIMLADLGGNP